jgi:hypothetical protein
MEGVDRLDDLGERVHGLIMHGKLVISNCLLSVCMKGYVFKLWFKGY